MQISGHAEIESVAVLGGGNARKFKANFDAHAFRIMSDTLYSDKPLAVTREYICNAYDAHIAAGDRDLPVEVTITKTEFKVKDYGAGIPEALIDDVYCTYFASTKRGDGAQTGGFGLGSKAGFSYSDHFMVTSAHQGMRRIYVMSKGDDGEPSNRLMGSSPCPDDEHGVIVSIPIKDNDAYTLERHVADLALHGGIPIILNGKFLDRNDYSTLPQAGYGLYRSTGDDIAVLLGSVLYPVDSGHVELADQYSLLHKLAQLQHSSRTLVLYAKPGSVVPVPSREALSYTQTTVATLQNLMARAIAAIEARARRKARELFRASLKDADRLTVHGTLAKAQTEAGRLARMFQGDGPDELANYAAMRMIAKGELRKLFFKEAARRFREGRKFLRDDVKVGSDQYRLLAKRGMRITRGLNARLYASPGGAYRFTALRRRERWSGGIDRPLDITIAPTIDGLSQTSVRFGSHETRDGLGIVGKFKADDIALMMERAEKFGMSAIALSPWVAKAEKQKKIAEKKAPVATQKTLFYPAKFTYEHLRGTGRIAVLKSPCLEKADAYLPVTPRRRKFGKTLDDASAVQMLIHILEKLYPNLALAIDDRSLKQLQAAGVPNALDHVKASLEAAIANDPKEQALAVLSVGAKDNHQAFWSEFAPERRLALKLLGASRRGAHLVADLPYTPCVDREREWTMWRIAGEIVGLKAIDHKWRNDLAALMAKALEAKAAVNVPDPTVWRAFDGAFFPHLRSIAEFIQLANNFDQSKRLDDFLTILEAEAAKSKIHPVPAPQPEDEATIEETDE